MDALRVRLLQLTLLMTKLCSAGSAGAGSTPEAPETAAEPGPRVRPRRLTRAEKGGYADNQEFMDEVCDLRSQTSSTIHHFWGNVEACNTVLDALQCLGFLQHLGDLSVAASTVLSLDRAFPHCPCKRTRMLCSLLLHLACTSCSYMALTNDDGNIFKRCTCALQLDRDSIAIEPDIPLYDLQDTMAAVGVPLEPEMPLLRALQVSGPEGLLAWYPSCEK